MKLGCSFEFVDMGEEIIAVPVGENANLVRGVLKLNKEGKEIIELLQSNISREQIVNTLSEQYTTDKNGLLAYVNETIKAIRDAGLLSE